jgi:hypothetical protein
MQTTSSTSARKLQDKTPMTPELLERAPDHREAQDVAFASTAAESGPDMHGYDELPFTD